jgi:uncharacterized circularly permuted ATP-grasp superfamily protein
MVFTHKGFLRQADKVKMPGKFQLIQYSADLVRGPLGKMWVLHDRTDAPSGAGVHAGKQGRHDQGIPGFDPREPGA